jgi:Ser/Thr protein kinase RdoA (MazF antagonist)
VVDEALAPWSEGAQEICPDATPIRVLRHLPGRRVATLVRIGDGEAVLKVFASPRARGNHRRLRALADSEAAGLLPRPLAVDRAGHVSLVEFVRGTPLNRLDDPRLISEASAAGMALRRIHDCGVALDRTWTIEDEAMQLRRTAGPATRATIEAVLQAGLPSARAPVPSHRDCYPAQAVSTGSGVRFIDADDAAMAPRALDVGNFSAHLTKAAVAGPRRSVVARDAIEAFLSGYGELPPDLDAWERLSLARLAALAETRHQERTSMRRLLAAVQARLDPRARSRG